MLISMDCLEVDSLVPGDLSETFKLNLVIDGWDIYSEIRWMSLDLTYVKSALIQVMGMCH